MAAKRDWQALSAAYRKRLSRAGITKRQYESGKSLAKARGHGSTPERPERAAKKPERYSDYLIRQRVREEKRQGANESARLRRELRRVARAIGVDYEELLQWIAPADRAAFVAGHDIAKAEYDEFGSYAGSFGRKRLDDLEREYTSAPKDIGFYH